MIHKILIASFLLVAFFTENNVSFGQTTPVPDTLIFSSFFSPNGDGHNDTFIIGGLEEDQPYHIIVYNLLGDLVYENDRYQNNWDGKANNGIKIIGKNLPEGIYYYVFTDLQNIQYKGQVTIKR